MKNIIMRKFKEIVKRILKEELLQILSEDEKGKIMLREQEEFIKDIILNKHLVFGEPARLKMSKKTAVNNATFNTVSGEIVIEDWVFFGHNVSVITGTHDFNSLGKERMDNIPGEKRDVIIRRGAWIASNATIIGPCVVGENAVVAACSLVNRDVPPNTVVGGVPARIIKEIQLKK
jgi:acetyltransferase-like isoleucine patch superfamily enzyme